jgi:transposase
MAEFKRRRGKPLRFVPVPLPDGHPSWIELDRLVPADHVVRRIRSLVEQLDLSDLLETYSGVGRAILPPDLLLAFVLFQTHRGHLSPAEWLTDSTESIPARWLLRGLRPSRAALYRFPDHLPPDLVDSLNCQILLPAQAEGFTSAQHGALDGTFTAAAGSRHRLLTSAKLASRLGLLAPAIAADDNFGRAAPPPDETDEAVAEPEPAPAARAAATAEPEPGPPGQAAAAAEPARPYWMAKTAAGRRRQHEAYTKAQSALLARQAEHEKKQVGKARSRRRSAEGLVICPSEPEAALGRDKCKVFRPLYNSQVVQDTDSRFVLGYGVYARPTDCGLLPPMLLRVQRLTGRKLNKVLADGIYASLKDARYCKDNGVELYAPVGAQAKGQKRKRQGGAKGGKGKGKKGEKLAKDKFGWQEEPRGYVCPQGHLLQLGRMKRKSREGQEVQVEEYRCDSKHCLSCPQALQCTDRPQTGRTVDRMVGQELLDEVAARMGSQEGKGWYKKRKQTVEPRHADMSEHRGLRRLHGYGLGRAQSQLGVIVLASNGLELLQARQRRKEAKAACAAKPTQAGEAGGATFAAAADPRPGWRTAEPGPAETARPPGPAPPPPHPRHSFDTDWLGFN